jgi:hypothetical protein
MENMSMGIMNDCGDIPGLMPCYSISEQLKQKITFIAFFSTSNKTCLLRKMQEGRSSNPNSAFVKPGYRMRKNVHNPSHHG